jgi:hypothetical protein
MARPVLMNGMASRQDIYEQSTTAYHGLGTRAMLEDGRVFYYCGNFQATAIATNLLLTGAARVANHNAQTQSTSGGTLLAGATKVTLDLAATTVTTSQYQDGYITFDSSTGAGQIFRIREHTTKAGAGTISVTLYDPIVVAGGTGTVISLYRNPFADPVIHAAAAAGVAPEIGVNLIAITAGSGDASSSIPNTTTYYFWAQTWGPCAVRYESTVAVGIAGVAINSAATAGNITGLAAADNDTRPVLFQAGSQALSNGTFRQVFLRIMP